MNYSDLMKFYERPIDAARALGRDRQLVYAWSKSGRIPLDQQVHIEITTKGKLRADLPAFVRKQAA